MQDARVQPLRGLLHVRRIKPKTSEGGIVLVHDYKAHNSPRLTYGAQGDFWPAEVLAVGPEARDLAAGDKILVYNFAEDTGTKLGLYTGVKVDRDEYIIDADKDVVCAVEDAPW